MSRIVPTRGHDDDHNNGGLLGGLVNVLGGLLFGRR